MVVFFFSFCVPLSFVSFPFPVLGTSPGLYINTHSTTNLNPQPQQQLGRAPFNEWCVTYLFIHSFERRLYRLRWDRVLCAFGRKISLPVVRNSSKASYPAPWAYLFPDLERSSAFQIFDKGLYFHFNICVDDRKAMENVYLLLFSGTLRMQLNVLFCLLPLLLWLDWLQHARCAHTLPWELQADQRQDRVMLT